MPVDFVAEVGIFTCRVRYAKDPNNDDMLERIDAECDCDEWPRMMASAPRERTCPHIERLWRDMVDDDRDDPEVEVVDAKPADEDAPPFGPDDVAVYVDS